MLGVLYSQHKTNDYVWQKVSILAGPQEFLLSNGKCRKLSWFGHVCRHDISRRCRGLASMGGHHSGGICLGTPMTPGRHAF